jgi:hypothetical protein
MSAVVGRIFVQIEMIRPRPGHTRCPISIKQAIALYNRFKCWKRVARRMPRPDGTFYRPESINQAVRRADKRC